MNRDFFINFEKHLLEDEKPSTYFNDLVNSNLFPKEHPFNMLSDLIYTEQSKEHHPEGSVWKHTMLVIDEAAKRRNKSEDKRVFMWAALLHDIGKAPTTKIRKGRITSYDHDKVGAEMAEEFLNCFSEDKDFIEKVRILVRYHMHILFVVKNLPFGDLENMVKDASIDELGLLGISDRLGRGNNNKELIEKEENNVKMFLELSKKYKLEHS